MTDIHKPPMDLNASQKRAVECVDQHVLILAGAGSGKTRVITSKIIHLIQRHQVNPQSILALTFTNKAANEMLTRVQTQLSKTSVSMRWLAIRTFHAYGAFFLRKFIDCLPGYDRHFSIIDRSEETSLIKKFASENHAFNAPNIEPKDIVNRIGRCKRQSQYPFMSSEAREQIRKQGEPDIPFLYEIYKQYQVFLNVNNTLDFDDLMAFPLFVIDQNEHCHEYLKGLSHVLVDEHQDTCLAQENLLKKMVRFGATLTVTGDDDQSIYSFRGAHIDNILQFRHRYPNVKVIKLQKNYRSTASILDLANDVIKHNKKPFPKRLEGTLREDFPVEMLYFPHHEAEVATVVDTISDMLHHNESPQEIAIFFRTNSQTYPFEDMLMRKGIPYKVVGNMEFFERKEIKEIIAYLQYLLNPQNTVWLLKIINFPSRGLGKVSLNILWQFIKAHDQDVLNALADERLHERLSKKASHSLKKFCALTKQLIEDSATLPLDQLVSKVLEDFKIIDHYKRLSDSIQMHQRLENLSFFLESAKQFQKRNAYRSLKEAWTSRHMFENFMEEISLKIASHEEDAAVPCISLMTVHHAKGLEFQHVFIVHLVEGMFPHPLSVIEGKLEEERRLFYVGITRAKRRLFLTASKYSLRNGRTMPVVISRFVRETNPKCFEVTDYSGVYHQEVKIGMNAPISEIELHGAHPYF